MKRLASVAFPIASQYLHFEEPPLEKIPISYKVPDELLYNILHFLDRKEIENKRMVSKQ